MDEGGDLTTKLAQFRHQLLLAVLFINAQLPGFTEKQCEIYVFAS